MSATVVREIIQRVATDSDFRERLSKAPDEVLKGYELTPEEKEAITAIKPAVMEAVAATHEEEKKKRPWWQPNSFKELGAAFLSLLLIVLLGYAALQTYNLINVLPQTVNVGDAVQIVDTFDRAKGLLDVFFPLFTAVVTFWLGVAIESRRADQNQEKADAEQQKREEAEQDKQETLANARATLSEAKGFAEGRLRRPPGLPPPKGVAAAGRPEEEDVKELVRILDSGLDRLA